MRSEFSMELGAEFSDCRRSFFESSKSAGTVDLPAEEDV